MKPLFDTVLSILLTHPDTWISGGKLATHLYTTRNSIWRIMKQLQEQGYDIESVTGRGYRLKGTTDPIQVSTLKAALPNWDIQYEPVIDSTNRRLKMQARQGLKTRTILLAEHQTQGVGRRGRAFFSPPNCGIYLSLLLNQADFANTTVSHLPALAAVACAEAIEACQTRACHIKWVNDLMMDGLKIGGILTEADYALELGRPEYVIIGIGLNVYLLQDHFPEELKQIAGAIYPSSEIQAGLRNNLILAIIQRITHWLKNHDPEALYLAYRQRCCLIDKPVTVWTPQQNIIGKAIGLTPQYALVVQASDTQERLEIDAGEATLHPPDRASS